VEGYYSNSTSRKYANVSASKCSNYVITGYTYDMNIYLGKDRQRALQHLTATHTTMNNLTSGVEGFGHKLYTDNFFSSLEHV